MMNQSPQAVFDKLIEFAAFDCVLSSSPSWKLKDCVPMPEKCKPGYLLTKLTEDERKVLAGLTSDMTRNERYPGT